MPSSSGVLSSWFCCGGVSSNALVSSAVWKTGNIWELAGNLSRQVIQMSLTFVFIDQSEHISEGLRVAVYQLELSGIDHSKVVI